VRASIGLLSESARALVYLAARVQGFFDHPDVRLQGRGVHGLEAVPVRQQLARGEEGPAGKKKGGSVREGSEGNRRKASQGKLVKHK
jgi:hypothetical protein